MPTFSRHFSLALAGALALTPVLRAAEPAAGTEAAAPAEAAAAKTKRPGRGPIAVDPMQDLRDRLAAKLGATKAGERLPPLGEIKAAAASSVTTRPRGQFLR